MQGKAQYSMFRILFSMTSSIAESPQVIFGKSEVVANLMKKGRPDLFNEFVL
jgi:hypothetical protein